VSHVSKDWKAASAEALVVVAFVVVAGAVTVRVPMPNSELKYGLG
jgi:hypothetical protein